MTSNATDDNIVQMTIAVSVGKLNLLSQNTYRPISDQMVGMPIWWIGPPVCPHDSGSIVVHIDVIIKAIAVQA